MDERKLPRDVGIRTVMRRYLIVSFVPTKLFNIKEKKAELALCFVIILISLDFPSSATNLIQSGLNGKYLKIFSPDKTTKESNSLGGNPDGRRKTRGIVLLDLKEKSVWVITLGGLIVMKMSI